MRLRLLLLLATACAGGCATALTDGTTTGDGGIVHDTSVTGDVGTDGTLLDAKDTTPIFETEGDAPVDSSVADTAAGDAKVDSSPKDTGVDSVAVDTAPDTAPDTLVVDVGSDTPITRCGATAPKVLIYGPVGTHEQPYVPTGSVVTVATDATWRAMTTPEFGAYNLIIIGEQGSGPGLGGAVWQAAYDTRATWNAAVTGRVVVTTLDPVAHVTLGTSAATTFLRAALSWAASGPGTGLYVGPDYGNRKLDFMSGFGTWTALGQNAPDNSYGDDVHVSLTSHGTMVGSSDTSLSSWSYSYHGSITTFPSAFVSVAASKSITTRNVVVARDVACPP